MATQLYTGPITVSVSQTIKAVALAPGKTVSNELVAAYVITGGGPFYYRRPDGVSRYLRPDGVSFYLRP